MILTLILPVSAFATPDDSGLNSFNRPTDITTMESAMVAYKDTLFYVSAGFNDYATFKQADKDFLADWLIANRPPAGYSSIADLRDTFASGMQQRSFMINLNSLSDSFSLWTLLVGDTDQPSLHYDAYHALTDDVQDQVCQRLIDNKPISGYKSTQDVQIQLDQAIASFKQGSSSHSSNPIVGQVTTDSNSPAALTKMLGSNVTLKVKISAAPGGTGIPDITIGPDGQFIIGSNVAAGQYSLVMNVIAPDGQVLAGQPGKLTVHANGTASMELDLIDPYGVITDHVTKQPIADVNAQLYWADTELNRSKGRTPDTLVALPELSEFDPNQNRNPQISTTDGRYGWMVFPDGDYYMIAKKDGYQTYDSRKDPRDENHGDTSYIRNGVIHVGQTIVELSFDMTNNHTASSSAGGYMNGYPDDTFRPDSPITRAEWASMLTRILPLTSAEGWKAYSDVASNYWAMQSIQAMVGNQFMVGYPDGTFHPDSPITRTEVADMIARIRHLEAQPAAFGDTAKHWASASIGAAQAEGLMSGYKDGMFRPDQPLTRAEAVTIVNRMLGITGSRHTASVTWRDVPPAYWAYDQIQLASR